MRTLIALLFLCSNLVASDFNRALDNSCIVSIPGIIAVPERGQMVIKVVSLESTGCVFKEDDEFYYVLTCGHQRKEETGYVLSFLRRGETVDIGATKYTSFDEVENEFKPDYKDYGVLFFYKKKAEELGLKFNPIPISLKDFDIKRRYYSVYRVGGMFDKSPRLVLSEHNISDVDENQFIASPKPFPGTSGSSIFNEDFTKIIGIQISSGGLCTRTSFIARHYEQSLGKSITQD